MGKSSTEIQTSTILLANPRRDRSRFGGVGYSRVAIAQGGATRAIGQRTCGHACGCWPALRRHTRPRIKAVAGRPEGAFRRGMSRAGADLPERARGLGGGLGTY